MYNPRPAVIDGSWAGNLLCGDCKDGYLHLVDVEKEGDHLPDATLRFFCEVCGCSEIKTLFIRQHEGVTLVGWENSRHEENHLCSWCQPRQVDELPAVLRSKE